MRIEEKNGKIYVDGINVIEHIGKLELETNTYVQRIDETLQLIKFYKTAEWGLKGYEILEKLEKSLKEDVKE